MSASVRLSAPVCSVLIIVLVKSWRFCTIDRFEPKADACERSVLERVVERRRAWRRSSASLSKSASPTEVDAEAGGVDRGRSPSTSLAWMSMVEVPVSLKVSFSLSPRSRLMPLNEASSASLSSWSRSSLNCLTRFLRTSLPPIVGGAGRRRRLRRRH